MKIKTNPIITVSTENENQFNDVIALCELLNLSKVEQYNFPYSTCSFISIYYPNNCFQPVTSFSTISEWNCTAKEFIESNF